MGKQVMTVYPTPNNVLKVTGIPDYYAIYLRWLKHFKKTNENKSKTLAYYYARVAEEMGQVVIEDDDTLEITA